MQEVRGGSSAGCCCFDLVKRRTTWRTRVCGHDRGSCGSAAQTGSDLRAPAAPPGEENRPHSDSLGPFARPSVDVCGMFGRLLSLRLLPLPARPHTVERRCRHSNTVGENRFCRQRKHELPPL